MLVSYLLIATALSVVTGQGVFVALVLSLLFLAAGVALYKTIVSLLPGFR